MPDIGPHTVSQYCFWIEGIASWITAVFFFFFLCSFWHNSLLFFDNPDFVNHVIALFWNNSPFLRTIHVPPSSVLQPFMLLGRLGEEAAKTARLCLYWAALEWTGLSVCLICSVLLGHYWDLRTYGSHRGGLIGTLRRKLVSPKKRGRH